MNKRITKEPAVLILAAGYILFFSLISILRYHTFDYNDFDLAIHTQIVWNILHGSIHSSILGISFLGNHMSLILFLIAPVYALFSTPLTLLLPQTLFIGLGVIPLYLLARDILARKFALLFCLLYLLYPALHFVNYFEFHPVSLAMLFLLSMVYYFEKEKFIPFLCFMFLSLLCKENISPGVFFFGLYVLFFRRRSWKWSLTPLLITGVWLILELRIMAFFNQGIIDFNWLYSYLGRTMPEAVIDIFRHPLIVLKYIFTEANMRFLFQLLLPLAFLCLLSPKVLFIAISFFPQQLLSLRLTDHVIYYHYTAKLVPFLFISAEFLPKLSSRKEVYSFHHVYIGKYTLSDTEYVLPEDVEYALIDFNDYSTFTSFYSPHQYKNLQKFFSKGKWGLLTAADNITLFKKGYKSGKKLCQVLKEPSLLSSMKFLIEDSVAIREYKMNIIS